MADQEKRFTEREMVEAKREAFSRGAYKAHSDQRKVRQAGVGATHGLYQWEAGKPAPYLMGDEVELVAAKLYPLPKVTRPRVVDDPLCSGQAFRIRDGRLEGRGSGISEWKVIDAGNPWTITPNRIRVWADLLANPTEEVEADS